MGGVPQLPSQIVELIFEHLYRDLTRPTLRDGDPLRPATAAPFFARFARVSKTWNSRATPFLTRYVPVAVARDALELVQRKGWERGVDWVDLTSGSGDRKTEQADWRRVLEVTLRHARRLDLDAAGRTFRQGFQIASCRDLVAALPALGTLPNLTFLYIVISSYWPLPTIGALARKTPNLAHLEIRGPAKRPPNPVPPLTFALSAVQALQTLLIASLAYSRFEVVTGLFPSLVYPSASTLVSLHLQFSPALATAPVSTLSIFPIFPSLRKLTLISGFLDCCHPAFFYLFPSLVEASIPAVLPLTPENFPLPRPSLRFLTFNIISNSSASGLLRTLSDSTLSSSFRNLLALDLDFVESQKGVYPSPTTTEQLLAVCEKLDIRLSGAFLLARGDKPWKYVVRAGERLFWTPGRDDVFPTQESEDEMELDESEEEGEGEDEDMLTCSSSSSEGSVDSLDYNAEDDWLLAPWWSEEKRREMERERREEEAGMAA